MGLKLGAELLRSPNGVWYSATGADGATLGVLRFEAALLKPAGAVDRLIERVVAARAGMLPGTLPVVDLVEDAGRIWLITAQVPVADSAGRTEALLLGTTPVSVPGGPGTPGVAAMGMGGMAGAGGAGGTSGMGGPGAPGGMAGSGGRPGALGEIAGSPGNAGGAGGVGSAGSAGGVGYAANGPGGAAAGNGVATGYAAQGTTTESPWRPSVDLGETRPGHSPVPGHVQGPGRSGPPPQWTKKELKDPLPGRLTRAMVGLVLVAAVVGAAAVVGTKMKDKKPTTPVKITGISVHNQNPVQPTGICTSTVDMVAEFTTNGGTGTVHYEWEIPAKNNQTQIVPGTQAVSPASPAVHLDWKLNLHGSGTVTAKFKITNPDVLAAGTEPSSSGDLKFQCP